ncbi:MULTISPECIES: hypothetical protein [Moraxella]|uniref:hypothetical protein n=1 Tax=Moraxella TaxID=475 RepID=UPI0007E3DB2F|nr:hypothetical protein [Moraxella catarrhalis]STY81716.1 Uncharacterised protein [Moraxella catarrhalis]
MESFKLITSDWSRFDYVNQWKHAVRFSLEYIRPAASIKRYESPRNKISNIEIYTIIPKNFLSDNEEDEGFYITESFIFITDNISVLSSKEDFEEIYEGYGNYFPIYYFDTKILECFYTYLSSEIYGISHWDMSTEQLKEILTL